MVALLAVLGLGTEAAATEIGTSRAFGLGLQAGAPVGITAKVYMSRMHAIDVMLATYFTGSGSFYVHAAYHAHVTELASGGGVAIPFRFGLGGFFSTGYWIGSNDDNDITLGGRLPVGLDFDLESIPLQFYIEAAVSLSIIPSIDLGGDGGIGARYYF